MKKTNKAFTKFKGALKLALGIFICASGPACLATGIPILVSGVHESQKIHAEFENSEKGQLVIQEKETRLEQLETMKENEQISKEAYDKEKEYLTSSHYINDKIYEDEETAAILKSSDSKCLAGGLTIALGTGFWIACLTVDLAIPHGIRYIYTKHNGEEFATTAYLPLLFVAGKEELKYGTTSKENREKHTSHYSYKEMIDTQQDIQKEN